MRMGGLILTGGASSRMGEDKAGLPWGGVRAVDRLAALARSAGCDLVCSVGVESYGLAFIPDIEPGGGPAAGLAAGVRALAAQQCDRALVLAVDAPTVTLSDLAPLLDAADPGAVYEGLPLPMVIEVAILPPGAGAGWPLRRLVDQAGLKVIASDPGRILRLRGANTPAERATLLAELSELPGSG